MADENGSGSGGPGGLVWAIALIAIVAIIAAVVLSRGGSFFSGDKKIDVEIKNPVPAR